MLRFKIFGNQVEAGVWQQDVLSDLPARAQILGQVHGTEILEVEEAGPLRDGFDAMVSERPGVRLMVKSADCLPLVFADEQAGMVAAVHAGWRGLVAEIIPKTLLHMQRKGADLARVKVGIGPSLGPDCAEFSDPLKEIPEKFHFAVHGRKVDLHAICAFQLESMGISMERVEWMKTCTHCDPAWFSVRRNPGEVRRFGTSIELCRQSE